MTPLIKATCNVKFYGHTDLGKSKASAAKRLTDLNPFIHIQTHAVRLSIDNALALFNAYEL